MIFNSFLDKNPVYRNNYSMYICFVFSAAYYLSCEMFKMYSNDEGLVNTQIDPDGSGPMPPFPVGCDGKSKRSVEGVF